jgi:hypothetical protein
MLRRADVACGRALDVSQRLRAAGLDREAGAFDVLRVEVARLAAAVSVGTPSEQAEARPVLEWALDQFAMVESQLP